MCKTHNSRTIDKCMKILIDNLNDYFGDDLDIIACCCGHGKYPISIVVKEYPSGRIYDFCGNVDIPRKKRFYKKDKQGYYFISEVLECLNKNKHQLKRTL